MKYGLYSPKCIVDMYSDRNIHYIGRSDIENIENIFYVHMPYVKTDDRTGYMTVVVCPDDVYIICYVDSVIPVIRMNVMNMRTYFFSSWGFNSFTFDDVYLSNDRKVMIANSNKIGINADKLRDYQVNAYDAIKESPHLSPFIPNFKDEYKWSFIKDGGILNWKYGIANTILLWIMFL